ncbi:Abi-alpha family protein [Citromicrobium bathyomarinum]|uniref:Abi-alpha family protein n=1 Tax=Citromicrobium bathyomarinum TaxID=72174 RepID=UPI00315B06B3
MGEQIKLYGSDRLRAVFQKAEELSSSEELNAIPPGFAVQLLQKASVSEDDPNLTEMWAHLLLSASKNFSNRHAIFADILSQINSFDAMQLNNIVPESAHGGPQTQMSVNQKSSLRQRFQSSFKWPVANADEARDEFNKLISFDLLWPGRVTSATYPYLQDGQLATLAGGSGDQFASYDALFRQGLIDRFSFDLGEPLKSPYLEGFLVSALGVRFTQTCRGLA